MNRQIIFLAIIALLLLGGGDYLFSNFGASRSELDTSLSTPYTEEIAAKLAELKKVKEVSLNFAVFDDKLFQKLRSVGQTATSTMTRGRVNPFLPF